MSAQFVISLIAGVVILIGGIVSLLWLVVGFPLSFGPISDLRHMVGEQGFHAFQIRYTVAGLSSGIAVILVSFMLRLKPDESKRWGVMIIVLSCMSILGMAGFFFGMALGVIGGVLAVIRSKSLHAEGQFGKPKVMGTVVTRMPEKSNVIFKCSACEMEFKNDEELRKHVLKTHII